MLTRLLNWLNQTTGVRRRYLTRGYRFTLSEALHASRGWLLDGYAVRLLEAEDGTWTLEAWEL